jgi:hypothetical protein
MIEIAELEGSKIEIDRWEVYQLLGYPREDSAEAKVRDSVRELIEFTKRIITPKYEWTILPIKSIDNSVRRVSLDGSVELSGEGIAAALKHAYEAGIFLVTIGEQISDTIKRMEERDVARSFFLDAVASVAVENLAETVHLEIARKAAEKGLYVGHRYSPGFCDWELTQQQILFSILQSDRIGVRLSPSCLMIPRKSVSAVVGLGRSMDQMSVSPCGKCRRKDCMARRENYINSFYHFMRSKAHVSL